MLNVHKNPTAESPPKVRLRWLYLLAMLIAVAGVISLEGCSSEIAVSFPGCEDCPDRCLRDGKSGKCVDCIKDEQCQSGNSPTRRCQDNKCICGSNDDCSGDLVCGGDASKGAGGCVQCAKSEDCKSADRPFCLDKECVPCQPKEVASCEPKDVKTCKKGTKKCQNNGSWGSCEDFTRCKDGEKCVDEKCVPDCPEPAPCEKEGKVCETDADDPLPGKYKECKKNARGCFELGEVKECGRREYCAKEACLPYTCPKPECALGDTQCVDADNMRICVKTAEDCLKWGEAKACEKGERCRLTTKQCTVCEPKDKRSCYSGKEDTKNKGVCRAGEQTCADDGTKWEDCKGEVIAQTETCNGLDDDCDGKVDNNLTPKPCDKQSGSCKGAVQRCDGTKGWQKCTAADYQLTFKEYEDKETLCDGKDNDCNGKIDDGLVAPKCQKQLGVCAGASKVCDSAKGWLPCDDATYTTHNPLYQTTETKCDGKDNDCDGSSDETFPSLGTNCTVGKGECQDSGKNICKTDGTGVQCSGTPKAPQTETCNGKDDDCDGNIDEGLTRRCYTGSSGCTKNSNGTYTCKGACKSGTQTCAGGRYGTCSGQQLATSEKCNGKDDDCDGRTDENWSLGGTCTVGKGSCRRTGRYRCKGNGTGRECSVSPGTPQTETCNGKDDDCDGSVDDGARCSRGKSCSSGSCKTCSQPGDTVVFVSCSLSCRCGLSCKYLDCWTPPIGPRICAKIGCR